jgi:hypothetical protein|tara:strand:+ start:4229 stop:5578 length:1350 start_codon:yes stop_codon:yes gene_type:complete
MNQPQPNNLNEVAQTREALPMSMRYALGNADAIPSSTIERMYAANNGSTYTPTVNEIRIPVQADGFLDTAKHYLNLEFKNLGTTQESAFDGDISSIFERITIESQGVELERLDDYTLLHNMKAMFNQSYTDREKRNALSGGPVPAINNRTIGITIEPNAVKNVSVQIDSGFLMGHHKKALPMGMAEFTIVIRLRATDQALVAHEGADNTNGYEVSNVRFFCPVYQILDMNVLNQYKSLASQRGISWSGDTNKLYIGSLTNSAGSTQTIQINDRSLSLKALITFNRPTNTYKNGRSFTSSASELREIGQYTYRINGLNYPQVPIKVDTTGANFTISRAYNQAICSFASPGFAHSEPLVNAVKFSQDYPAAAAGLPNGADAPQGCMCVDLRRFDDEKLSYVGLNTSKNASPNILEVVKNSVADQTNSTTSTYAICEAEYTMSTTGRLSVIV